MSEPKGLLIFRGVAVEKVEAYFEGAQRMVEIQLSADWTQPVCEQMGWAEEPMGFLKCPLAGTLAGVNVMFTANKRDLKDYDIDITFSQAKKFVHVPSIKDNQVVDRRLTFTVTTIHEDALVALDHWLKNVSPSDAKAQCKLRFSPEQQMKLDEAPEEDEKQEVIPGTEAPTRGRRRSADVQ